MNFTSKHGEIHKITTVKTTCFVVIALSLKDSAVIIGYKGETVPQAISNFYKQKSLTYSSETLNFPLTFHVSRERPPKKIGHVSDFVENLWE